MSSRRNKRIDPRERELDIDYMLRLRLMKVPAGEILKRLNALRVEAAYKAALGAGMPEEGAREFAADATISAQTMRADFRLVLQRLKASNADKGEALVLERLDELELARQTLLLGEQRAWEELARSDQAIATITSRRDAVEILPPGAPAGTPPERSWRPRDEQQQRQGQRSADPRWMERIESLVWKQVLLGREIFQLRAILGMEVPAQLKQLAQAGSKDEAREGLVAHEVGLLYSLEARAAGIDPATARARFQLVSAYLEEKGVGGGKGAGGGTGRSVTFQVLGLEVGGGEGEIP